MELIAALESKSGKQTSIYFHHGKLKSLGPEEHVDAYIVSTEDGFSPLGSNRGFLSSDLDIPVNEIARLADWNRFKNPKVTLVALQSRRKGSRLRGVILAPSESSICYEQFATHIHGHPYRDYFYNVAYESIAYISRNWGAQHIAVSNLFRGEDAGEDIVTCNAEALAHFCDEAEVPPKAFTFLTDVGAITRGNLAGIQRLNAEAKTGKHRPISTELEQHEGYVLVHLEWRNASEVQ